MAYFDYSRPDVPDFSEGIRRLGDDLAIAKKRKDERQKHEELMALEREKQQQTLAFQREQEQRRYDQQKQQYDYQNRIEDRKEKVARQDFNMRQQAFHNQQAKEIQAQLAAGNIEGARRIAAQTTTFDPETGRETSRGTLEQGPARAIGAEPLMPESGTTVGPDDVVRRDQVESADPVTLIMDPRANERRQAAADAENLGKMRRFDAEAQAYSEEAKRAEAERPYTFKLGPNDPGVSMSIRGQRNELWERNANDFLASLSGVPMTDADKVAAANTAAALRRGGDINKANQAYNAERLQGIKAEDTLQLQGVKDAAALERAKIPKPGIMLQERRFGFEEGKERSKLLRADIEKFMTRHGAKTIQEDNLQIPQIERDLRGNPQQQRNAMIALWYMTQHDHRLSDQDAIMAMTVDPSMTAKIGNWISQKSTGALDPDVQATALQTAAEAKRYLAGKVAQMKAIAKHSYIESGQYDPQEADVVLEQQLPGWERMFPNGTEANTPRGGPPEVNAKRKAKSKGGKSVKVKAPTTEEALELLEGTR